MSVQPMTTTGAIRDTAGALSPVLGIPREHLQIAMATGLRHVVHDASLDDRLDLIQTMGVRLLATRSADGSYATVVCKNLVRDWNTAWHYREHYSIDAILATEATESPSRTYLDVIHGRVEFEAQLVSSMDARSLWQSLPAAVRGCLSRRIQGIPLSKVEQKRLERFRHNLTGVFSPVAA